MEQSKADVAPAFTLNVPPGQGRQADWPDKELYVPAGHGRHAPDEFAPVTAPNVPDGQG